jgi:hypothetical protein
VEPRLAASDAGQQAVVSVNAVSGSSFRHGTFDPSKELRRNLIGNVEWHVGTLKLWIEIFEATH